MNPHKITRDFEQALCEYTGAPNAVAVTSCTMALLLAAKLYSPRTVRMPKRSYVSVPMSMMHAGHKVEFDDVKWGGYYRLNPLPIWDSARWFSAGMFRTLALLEQAEVRACGAPCVVCVSFHASKTLALEQGGAILHNFGPEADARLRRLRFDGRSEGVPPKQDAFSEIGYHAYLSPSVSAMGIFKLSVLPRFNEPLPNDDYPDLSTLEIFK